MSSSSGETPTRIPAAPSARMTSGQLKARAAASKLKTPSKKVATRPTPARPEDTREITVQRWSQASIGRNPLLRSFVSTQARGRTAKRIPGEWQSLYQDFLKAPRG